MSRKNVTVVRDRKIVFVGARQCRALFFFNPLSPCGGEVIFHLPFSFFYFLLCPLTGSSNRRTSF
jgi:hypothetical protein